MHVAARAAVCGLYAAMYLPVIEQYPQTPSSKGTRSWLRIRRTHSRIGRKLLYRLQGGIQKPLGREMNTLPVALQSPNFVDALFDHQDDRLTQGQCGTLLF